VSDVLILVTLRLERLRQHEPTSPIPIILLTARVQAALGR
jgi:hypothetical protein